MIKRIASIFFVFVFILMVISVAFTSSIKLVASAETVNEGTIEFSTENDVAKMWSYNTETPPELTTDGDTTVLKTSIKQWGQARVSLPIKLQSGKTYTYSIKYRFSDSSIGGQYIRLFVGSTGQYVGDPSKAANKLDDTLYNSSGPTTYTQYDGEFDVTAEQLSEEQNLLSLYMKNDAESNQTFYIDKIEVRIKGTSSDDDINIVDEKNFEFEEISEISSSVGYGGIAKPDIAADGDKSVLSLSSKYGAQARVSLPFELEANKTYTYKIKYRVDTAATKGTFLYLFGATNGSSCGYDATNILIKVLAGGSVSNTEYSEFTGDFTTTETNVAEPHNLLGIFLQSENTQTFYIDSINIKLKDSGLIPDDDIENEDELIEGAINFNVATDIKSSVGYGGVASPSIQKDGNKSVLSMSSKYGGQTRITLPIELEANKVYTYSIKYRVDSAAEKGTFLYLYGATDESSCGYNKDNIITKVLAGSSVSNIEYSEFTGEFTTTETNVAEPHNLLGIFLQSENTQTFYIDAFILEVEGDAEEIPETVFIEEGTVEFNTNADVVSSFCYGGTKPKADNDGEKTVLSFVSETDKQKRVTIPVKLKPGMLYSYSIKYRVDKPSNSGMWLYMYSGNAEESCGYTTDYILNKQLENSSLSNTTYSEFTGEFITSETTVTDTNNLLGFLFKGNTGYNLYIDSITVKIECKASDIPKPTIIEEGTVEFDSRADVMSSFCAGGTKPLVGKDGNKGTLVFVSETDKQKRVTIPVKLKPGMLYSYSIKYRVDKPSNSGMWLYLYSGNDENACGYTTDYILNKQLENSSLSNTTYSEFTGEFITSETTVTDTNNLLGFLFKGNTGYNLYIDSITVKIECKASDIPKPTIIEEGTVEFDSRADVMSSFCAGGTKPLVGKDGNKGTLVFVSETDKQKRVTIPVKLKPGRTYTYTIKYRVNKPTTSNIGTWLYLYSGNDESACGYTTDYILYKQMENSSVSNIEYGEFRGSFKTTDETVTETNNLLGFLFKSSTEQIFYIDSIEIEWEKTETFGPIINFGKLDFNTYNQLELVQGKGATIIKDGDRKVLAIEANGGVSIRLPVKVENGKKIAYTMKARVVSNIDSEWFHGKSYWAFMLGDGKTDNANKFLDINNNDAKLNIIYNFAKVELTDGYEEFRGRIGYIKTAADGMDYLCIRYKGDATIYIDEIEFRDYSNDIYGNDIHDSSWELPEEDDSIFTAWKNWATGAKRETNKINSSSVEGNSFNYKAIIVWIIGGTVVFSGIAVLIIVLIKYKRKVKK